MLSGRSRLLDWSCGAWCWGCGVRCWSCELSWWGCGVRCWGCELSWRSCEVLCCCFEVRCWKSGLLCVYVSASLGHASPRYVFGEAEGWLMAPRSYLGFSGLVWSGVRVPTLCVRPGRGVVDGAEVIFGVLWIAMGWCSGAHVMLSARLRGG